MDTLHNKFLDTDNLDVELLVYSSLSRLVERLHVECPDEECLQLGVSNNQVEVFQLHKWDKWVINSHPHLQGVLSNKSTLLSSISTIFSNMSTRTHSTSHSTNPFKLRRNFTVVHLRKLKSIKLFPTLIT